MITPLTMPATVAELLRPTYVPPEMPAISLLSLLQVLSSTSGSSGPVVALHEPSPNHCSVALLPLLDHVARADSPLPRMHCPDDTIHSSQLRGKCG